MRTALWSAICLAAGCASAASGQADLNGAGATFPFPLYSKWFDAYARKTGVKVNYQSIGSGGGIRQFTQGTVDFGATDGPMTDEQIVAVKGNVVHVPTILGAVVLTYNLPRLGAARLRLDAPAIADIFLGKITRWNDPRLAALNPGLALPNRDLLVVHRSDGSGTTYVFVDYLSKVSDEWRTRVGTATSVNWPTGLGGKGNEGVTQQVKQLEGTIGYVELVYALANKLPYAQVRNPAGRFVEASLEAVSAAAAGANLPGTTDFRVSITNAAGEASYPIASFTWLLVPQDNPSAQKAGQIKQVLTWILSAEAQDMARSLGYAPLPAPVAGLVRERLKALKAGGRPLG
jgi:phosphate transport system substrate-binding protein